MRTRLMSARRAGMHASVVCSLSHPCRYGNIVQSCVYLAPRVSLARLISIHSYSKGPRHTRASSDQHGVLFNEAYHLGLGLQASRGVFVLASQ